MNVVIQYEIGLLFTVQIVPFSDALHTFVLVHGHGCIFVLFRVIFAKHKEIWEIRTMTDASSSQYSAHIAVPGSVGLLFFWNSEKNSRHYQHSMHYMKNITYHIELYSLHSPKIIIKKQRFFSSTSFFPLSLFGILPMWTTGVCECV